MGKADKKQPRTFWKARGCFCFTGSSLPQGGQARREKCNGGYTSWGCLDLVSASTALPKGTKKPRRAALQPHSGGKDEELLFTHSTVVVLNADSDTDIAPLVIAADHNTYIGPDAILVHAGIDLRIDILRNLSQH